MVGLPFRSTMQSAGTCSPFAAANRTLLPEVAVVAKSTIIGELPAGNPIAMGLVCKTGRLPP